MGNSSRRRKKDLWNRCPYCFWCGRLTILTEYDGKIPKDAATVDHLRSRNIPNRAEQPEKWQIGITVLACSRCNNLRGKHEAHFLRDLNEELFYEKGNSRPIELDFESLHGAIASTLAACLNTHDDLNTALQSTKRGRKLLQHIRRLHRYRQTAKVPNEI